MQYFSSSTHNLLWRNTSLLILWTTMELDIAGVASVVAFFFVSNLLRDAILFHFSYAAWFDSVIGNSNVIALSSDLNKAVAFSTLKCSSHCIVFSILWTTIGNSNVPIVSLGSLGKLHIALCFSLFFSFLYFLCFQHSIFLVPESRLPKH